MTGLRRIKSIYGDACARCKQKQCPAWCAGSDAGVRRTLGTLDLNMNREFDRSATPSLAEHRRQEEERKAREARAVVNTLKLSAKDPTAHDGQRVAGEPRIPAGWKREGSATLALTGENDVWMAYVCTGGGGYAAYRCPSYPSYPMRGSGSLAGTFTSLHAAMLAALGCEVRPGERGRFMVEHNGSVCACDKTQMLRYVERLTAERAKAAAPARPTFTVGQRVTYAREPEHGAWQSALRLGQRYLVTKVHGASVHLSTDGDPGTSYPASCFDAVAQPQAREGKGEAAAALPPGWRRAEDDGFDTDVYVHTSGACIGRTGGEWWYAAKRMHGVDGKSTGMAIAMASAVVLATRGAGA